MTPLKVYCPICQSTMDWQRGYGRDCHCCCRQCHEEFSWRYALSVLDKAYYPRPAPEDAVRD